MRSLICIVLICALPSCSLLAPDKGEVSVRSDESTLFITNGTNARVYYFVVGRGALLLWAPHTNLEASIVRGATAKINHQDISHAENAEEVIVYWWHAVKREGKVEPGETHAIIVRLGNK